MGRINMKPVYLILILLAFAIPASAQDELTLIANQVKTADLSLDFITPGHVLYNAKIGVEDIHEALTLDPTRKVLLKQAHLNARIRELQEDATRRNSRNAVKILQKLQIKRMEIDASLEDLKPKCADIETGEITACKDFGTNPDSGKKKIYEAVKLQNVNVLTKLLESEKMPEQSRKGLTNAIEKSGLKSDIEKPQKTLTANMVQTYKSTAISYIPFRTATVYIKGTGKQYAVVLYSNSATISDEMQLDSPDYYLYLTKSQMNELTNLAQGINSKKKLSWQDSIKLMNLWMEIEKKAGGN